MPSWVEKTSRFSKDGALIPRSIRLRKSTEISSSSANCSWLMLRANRMVLMRLPNFSRRADKHCTCGPNVAHTQLSNHRMRLRVVMRLRVEAFVFQFALTVAKCLPMILWRNRRCVKCCLNRGPEIASWHLGREVSGLENGFSTTTSGPVAHEFLRHNPPPWVCWPH